MTITAREYAQLSELVEVLDRFLEATNLTHGEHVVTASIVVPCTLSLYRHLDGIKRKYIAPLVRTLKSSLSTRFADVFVAVGMGVGDAELRRDRAPTVFPFNDMYLVAAALDPTFGLFWIDHDVFAAEEK